MQYSKKLLTQSIVAKVAALIDERAPLDELDRAWSILLRLWNAIDRSTLITPPASDLPALSLPDDG